MEINTNLTVENYEAFRREPQGNFIKIDFPVLCAFSAHFAFNLSVLKKSLTKRH